MWIASGLATNWTQQGKRYAVREDLVSTRWT
jgi:hypothetical protein